MTVTSASLLQTSALGSSSPAIRRIAVVLTSLVAGAVGCVIAYWTWRMVLKIPLGLEPDLRLGAVNAPSQGTPGAPWWVIRKPPLSMTSATVASVCVRNS